MRILSRASRNAGLLIDDPSPSGGTEQWQGHLEQMLVYFFLLARIFSFGNMQEWVAGDGGQNLLFAWNRMEGRTCSQQHGRLESLRTRKKEKKTAAVMIGRLHLTFGRQCPVSGDCEMSLWSMLEAGAVQPVWTMSSHYVRFSDHRKQQLLSSLGWLRTNFYVFYFFFYLNKNVQG